MLNVVTHRFYRYGQVSWGLVIELLDGDAHVAVCELFGQGCLDLATVFSHHVGSPYALATAVEAAQVEIGGRIDRTAIGEVHTLLAVVSPHGHAYGATAAFAGFGLEVHDRARSIGRQCGRRTAAQHVDAVDGIIGAQELVGRSKGNVAEQHDGEAVFLQLHIAATSV